MKTLTTREAAKVMLGERCAKNSWQWVLRLIRKGDLKGRRIGKFICTTDEAIESFLRKAA